VRRGRQRRGEGPDPRSRLTGDTGRAQPGENADDLALQRRAPKRFGVIEWVGAAGSGERQVRPRIRDQEVTAAVGSSGVAAASSETATASSVTTGTGTPMISGANDDASSGAPIGTGVVPWSNSGNGIGSGTVLSGVNTLAHSRENTVLVPPNVWYATRGGAPAPPPRSSQGCEEVRRSASSGKTSILRVNTCS
jgi:hypothetical protein